MKLCTRLWLLFALLCSSFMTIAADRITLKNGDMITGKVISKENGILLVKTSWAGKIKVKWTQVNSVEIDRVKRVSLRDGSHIEGRLQADKSGQYLLEPETGKKRKLSVAAIVKIGKTDAERKRYESDGHVKLAGSFSTGNTDTRHSSIDIEVVYFNYKNRFTLDLVDNNAEENDVKTLSNRRFSVKYDRFIDRKQFLYIQAGLYQDSFKDIDEQQTIGLGYGYQFWSSANRKLSLEAGLTRVDEELIIAPDRSYSAFRWAFRYKQKLKWRKLKLFHRHDGLWDLDDTGNVTVTSRTGIDIPLVRNLDATVQVNIDWDSEPTAGTDKTDVIYLLGISYRW